MMKTLLDINSMTVEQKLGMVFCARKFDEDSLDFTIELIKKRALEYNADIRLIDAPGVDVSSTQIREKLRRGESTDGLLDGRVLEFIKDKGLYV